MDASFDQPALETEATSRVSEVRWVKIFLNFDGFGIHFLVPLSENPLGSHYPPISVRGVSESMAAVHHFHL